MQEWDDDAVMAIDYWFKGVMSAFHGARQRETDPVLERARAAVGFNLFAQVLDACCILLPGQQVRRGNCANWTSQALFFAGLLERTHMFPKATFVDLFENLVLDQHRRGAEPLAKVVYLRQAAAGRSERAWQVYERFEVTVAPLEFLKNIMYRNLESFADAVVEVAAAGPELATPLEDVELVGEDAAAASGARGPLVARVRAGRARKPTWMRCFPFVRYWHFWLLSFFGIFWIKYGFPDRQYPLFCMYLSRVLTVFLILLINAILN